MYHEPEPLKQHFAWLQEYIVGELAAGLRQTDLTERNKQKLPETPTRLIQKYTFYLIIQPEQPDLLKIIKNNRWSINELIITKSYKSVTGP